LALGLGDDASRGRAMGLSASICVVACVLACGKAEMPDVVQEEGNQGRSDRDSVVLTKVVADVGNEYDGEIADIFVYNDDRTERLDVYQRTVMDGGLIEIARTKGKRKVVVVVRGQLDRYEWSGNNSYNYIRQLDVDFTKDNPALPTLSGEMKLGDGKSEGEIKLNPLLSKIVLRSIRADFKGRAYEGAKLTDIKIYLTNVNTLCNVVQADDFPSRGVLNAGRLSYEDLGKMDHPEMVYTDLGVSAGTNWTELNAELFCYPNTNEEESIGSPYTRLVIEGKIQGNTWYYPININREGLCWVDGIPGIDRNCQYVYDVTIKRTGSSDPDKPISIADVEISCIVESWKEMEERDEVY